MAISKRLIKYYQLILFLCLSLSHQGQNRSVLDSGDWVKLGVTSKGIYKINYETFQHAGFDPNTVITDNIQLHGQAGGMLPQSNSENRASDLLENAIYTVGFEDKSFDPNDYILFYSEGPHLENINRQGHLVYEKNLYADTAYYFLTVSTKTGKRMNNAANLGDNYPEIRDFIDYRFHEPDLENILSSGRQWFGPLVTSTSTVRVNFDNIPPLSEGAQLNIVSSVVNRSQERASFNFSLNGTNLGSIEAAGIGPGTYDDKGVIIVDTLNANNMEINHQGTFNFDISYEGAGNGLFDYLQVSFISPLTFREPAVYFRSVESLKQPTSTFRVSNVNETTVIWDVTDPQNIMVQDFVLMDDQAIYSTQTSSLKEFVVFSGNDFLLPVTLQPVNNQNLHGIEVPNLLIVTHPSFLVEAERLASFRSQNDQLDVQVVTTDQVFNEFSSGRQDVTAIRDYARYLYQKNTKLRYLLLFGRSSFDYKNITEKNTNYVPTYQSRNSIHPIYSYNSDDYFGFLDEALAWGDYRLPP
jgi:hypothetical protein